MKRANVVQDTKPAQPCPWEQISWLLIGLCALINLAGCVTAPDGFSQFYQAQAGAGMTHLPPYSGSTKIITSSEPITDAKELFRNGYGLIGFSAFRSPTQSDSAWMAQAKKVGADVVLISSEYLGSEQMVVPYNQYSPGQSYTATSSGTVNANARGSGGYAYGTGNYYESSTTTAPGTFNTQLIPVIVQRYQYEAGFFRRMPPVIFGVMAKPLPSEIRQQLERNTGVSVFVVVNGSPAFNANILEGDVILKVNGENVESVADFREKYTSLAGQKVDVEIWRNGQFKKISVQLNKKSG